MWANNEADFDKFWQALQNKYNPIDEDICLYLEEELLPKKRKWCKVWTDKIMHFDNTTTSRDEGSNANLKKELSNSKEDLKTVVDTSAVLCDRQRGNYRLNLDKAKQRLDHRLRAAIYRDLQAYVTLYALREIDKHYKRLTDTEKKNAQLPACTEVFKRTMDLPCAHVIEKRRADAAGGKVLKLTDVHPHWRFKKPPRHYTESAEFANIDEVDMTEETPVQDPLL